MLLNYYLLFLCYFRLCNYYVSLCLTIFCSFSIIFFISFLFLICTLFWVCLQSPRPSVFQSIRPFVYFLVICIFVCLSVCLSVGFEHSLAPSLHSLFPSFHISLYTPETRMMINFHFILNLFECFSNFNKDTKVNCFSVQSDEFFVFVIVCTFYPNSFCTQINANTRIPVMG